MVMAEIPDKLSVPPTHTDDADDLRLVDQFKCGDGSAFDRIVNEYAADVRVLANRLMGWDGDVEDVVQEVFLSAFTGLKKFKGRSSLRTWLYSITINKCRSHRRKKMIRLRAFPGNEVKHDLAATASDSMTAGDFDQVRKAVRSLPFKYCEVVVLRYLQESSIEKMCEVLGLPANVIHVRLSRARAMLKQKLSNLMDD
jgi:RNA polymerase sigma-70 factor (ECF subfamily)